MGLVGISQSFTGLLALKHPVVMRDSQVPKEVLKNHYLKLTIYFPQESDSSQESNFPQESDYFSSPQCVPCNMLVEKSDGFLVVDL